MDILKSLSIIDDATLVFNLLVGDPGHPIQLNESGQGPGVSQWPGPKGAFRGGGGLVFIPKYVWMDTYKERNIFLTTTPPPPPPLVYHWQSDTNFIFISVNSETLYFSWDFVAFHNIDALYLSEYAQMLFIYVYILYKA